MATRTRTRRHHLPCALLVYATALLVSGAAQAQQEVGLADGSSLLVFLVEPEQTTAQPSPLLILMGGGSGNLAIARDVSRWLASGFAQRGWMVAVPVSPNNRAFRGAPNNARIAQLIEVLQGLPNVAEGKTLLAGISNGGMSALEIARRDPDKYFGVVAVPALSGTAFENRSLEGFPVYLRIGSDDQLGWAERFEQSVAVLTEAGVDLDAAILDGEQHMFRMDWESLDPWLARVTQATP